MTTLRLAQGIVFGLLLGSRGRWLLYVLWRPGTAVSLLLLVLAIIFYVTRRQAAP